MMLPCCSSMHCCVHMCSVFTSRQNQRRSVLLVPACVQDVLRWHARCLALVAASQLANQRPLTRQLLLQIADILCYNNWQQVGMHTTCMHAGALHLARHRHRGLRAACATHGAQCAWCASQQAAATMPCHCTQTSRGNVCNAFQACAVSKNAA